ncbi:MULTISPECIES: ATP-binding protein [Pseudomonas]|jgi:two-component system OmpR family sensor kinase|uniref:histidine kinase n=1 Tax=Pseudomonas syringae TaxID=317 RepID=A0A085UV97_PSESX|nr:MULTISPECIES: ATP-binding protein [Pseudomonas]EPJ79963.1 periplasmic sensor Signal transduction histidine kinase [Pseudomonas sp. CFII64]KFE47110.1 histidine kinase [Pseudomonas syringae]
MFKMLARLYLIMLVTYGVALYTVPGLVLSLFDERTVTYNQQQAKGTLRLIQVRFSQTPQDAWPALERELQADFAPLQLRVISLADPSLTDSERQALKQGKNAVRSGYFGELGTALTRLPDDHVIELVAPDPPIDINIIYWLMNILVGAALLACLLIWVWPHWRDLQRLKRTAMMLGNGNLTERTRISPRSNIGELAQVFDKMAQDIEGLLNQQQELLNAVSHELRTPLSRLEFGMALVMADPLEAPTRLRLEQMLGHVRELDALIDELLSYTRLQSPYQLPELQEVPMQAYLDSVLGGFIDEQDSRQFTLILQFDETPERFVLDPRLTARAIQNLINNAIRYCERQVRVIAQKHADKGLMLSIEDDGIGIPVDERERVFEPFYRMDRSRDRDTGGFGLGLAISRRAIECQGGRIILGSSPLGGARFELFLPLASTPRR